MVKKLSKIGKVGIMSLMVISLAFNATGAYAQYYLTLNAGDTYSGGYNLSNPGDYLTINVTGGTATFNGSISGGYDTDVAIIGSGTLVMNSSNDSYYGRIAIVSGTLTLGASGGIANASEVELTGKLNISAGDKTINNLKSSYVGAEVILGSRTLTVNVGYAQTFAGIISGTGGSLIKNGGANFILDGANSYTGSTTINAGTLTIGTNGTLPLASLAGVTLNGSGKLNIASNKTIRALNSSSSTSSVELGANTLSIGTSASSSDGGGDFAGVISGTGGIVKNGTGTLALDGVNTYTGATTINAGTLYLDMGGSIANSSGVTLNGSGKLDISSYSGGKTIKTLNSSSTASIVELGTSSNVLMIGTSTTSSDGNGTFAGKITGMGGITKAGTAAFTLNGNNDYTEMTVVFAGTLVLGASGTIANSSSVALSGGNLDISAGNKTIKSLGGYYASSEVVLGNRTLTIDGSSTSDFEGKFIGAGGSITKQGTGTFIFSNTANTATGTFTCSQGYVTLSGNWAGNFVKNSASALTVTGNRTIGGTLAMNGGTTDFNLNGATPSRLSATGAMTASGTNTLNISSMGSASSYTLISAASGVTAAPFAVTGATGTLSATATQLTFSTNAFVPVTNIIGVPEAAVANVPLTLSGTVVPSTATNQTIAWSVEAQGTTGATIATGTNILNTTASGTAKIKATIANGLTASTPYVQYFDISVGTVGIDDYEFRNYRVFPNPTTGQLHIESGELKIENIVVFDITGRNMGTYQCGSSESAIGERSQTIDISHLPSGIYFVKAGNEIVKIIKQ